MSTIKDLNLAESGERKIRWVEAHMPVLRDIGSDFAREKPFAGLKIALSVHLEAKTAYLCRVLEMGGAEMHVTGSNPLSTAARTRSIRRICAAYSPSPRTSSLMTVAIWCI